MIFEYLKVLYQIYFVDKHLNIFFFFKYCKNIDDYLLINIKFLFLLLPQWIYYP